MGSPITNMLQQGAAQNANGQSQEQIDAERDARIKALLAQVAANQQADPTLQLAPPTATAPSPSPSPAPAQSKAPSGIMAGLMGLLNQFANSAPAKPAVLPTAPLTPEQLAARNRAISGQ